MRAVLLTGHGGLDKLEVRDDVPVPRVGTDEVLIRVAAAGVNNTDINTRLGWYSKTVSGGTAEVEAGSVLAADGAWSGAPLTFPLIQGADCCGYIVAVGDAVDPDRVGERVIVRPMMAPPDESWMLPYWTLGSECNGAFAEYTAVPGHEAYRIDSSWTDIELASVPCAYSTAENLLHRADVGAGDHVLITGASGGVGSAAVQLASRRGAFVVAVSAPQKADVVSELGADRVVSRDANLSDELGRDSIDAVIDVVGGASWPALLDVLRNGGRLATSGAIGGPIVELDLRTLYLKDLTLLGCTSQERIVFENLVGYIERGEIRPVVAETYPLEEIAQAQQSFIEKRSAGKLVLVVG